jgi:hypothetical protein
MILAGHQPNFLPNLGFFAKIMAADIFIISSHLQLARDKSWHRRHRLPGPHNDIWLSVPVLGSHRQLIRDTKINNSISWRRRHQQTLRSLYARQPGYKYLSGILHLYDFNWERLVDFNWALIRELVGIFQITTPIFLDETTTGKNADLIINTCRRYNAQHYLSGVGGKQYMDKNYCNRLRAAGIHYSFLDHNLASDYPYSSIHYLATYGPDWVNQRVEHSLNFQAKSV